MSGVTSATGGFLGQLANNSAAVKRQLEAAQVQQSTGYVSDSYSGLGSGARTSLDLSPAVQHLQVWQGNIDTATSKLGLTQTVLTQISSIASDFYARTNALGDAGVSEAGTIGTAAKSALAQVSQLLNTRDGNVYIFAGQDTSNPPLPSTDPAVVGAAVLASDTATAPFSATIGTSVPQIEVGDGQRVPVGALANQNTQATSAAPTTGSYARDILRALASLATVTNSTQGAAVADDTRARLRSAIGAISDETGALGNVQADLAKRKDSLAATQTALSGQLANAQDVDIAATFTRVSALQTQLQASYQVLAGAKGLSLANYL